MPYPSFAESTSAKSAIGVAKETTFRTAVTPTAFTPFDQCTLDEDPATFSPQTMIGVLTTDVYALQGEIKVAGNIKAPLYAQNGVPLLVGSVGQDASSFNGVTGVPHLSSAGSPGSAGSSTSFAATGVTSITATGITGTFAAHQVIYITGSTDAAGGGELVSITTFSTPTITCSATTKIHTGTILVQTVGAVATSSPAAGGSTVVLNTGLGALFTTNDIIQIDSNTTTNTAECRKVTVSTDTLTIADASPNGTWGYAHTTPFVINVSGGLFTHTIPEGTLNSYTVEKNVGNVQSLVFPGCKMGKCSLTVPTGNAAATIQVDAMGAAQPTVQTTPTSASVTSDNPFIFAEATFTALGATHPEAYNFKIDWDNVLKDQWGYTGTHFPAFLTKTNFHVSGTFDAVFQNFNDASNGFWTKMDAQTEGSLTMTLTHTSDSSLVTITLPRIRLTKATQTYGPGTIVTQPISFKGFYSLSSSLPNMTLTVTNTTQYVPY